VEQSLWHSGETSFDFQSSFIIHFSEATGCAGMSQGHVEAGITCVAMLQVNDTELTAVLQW
jgi:hypothetical protein